MFKVGDGDAIVMTLEKQDSKLLVVIDGGDTSYATRVCNYVQAKCDELQKEGPDLIICTHYDSDHIAGVIKMAEHFRSKIKMIWVHKPPALIKESFSPVRQLLENQRKVSAEAESLRTIQLFEDDPEFKFNFLLESLIQLNTLISLINDNQIPNEEPFAGQCYYKGWEELVILGPTKEYFDSLFGKLSVNEFFAWEHHLNLLESKKIDKPRSSNPCESLKTNPDTSKCNLSSVILRIDVGNERLLFTGDAGVKSFKNALNFPGSVRDVTFLKIPHHASENNINKELIDLINPVYAFNSGDGYESSDVIDCFKAKKGRVVKTTKADGDLAFSFQSP
jgi:beta-lactamase superfamily II metal-dependent hydrolase